MRRIAVLCILAVLAAVTVACAQSQNNTAGGADTQTATSSPAAEPAPGGPTITIQGLGFSSALTVAPGTEITIVNNDEVEHSVTSRTADLFDVHVEGKQRATLTAPSQPGEYAFYCVYHPAMVGTLTVR